MRIPEITVTTSPAELKPRGKWDEACDVLGLHSEVASEMEEDAPIVLGEGRAKDLGLLA
jgi:hypothetical protein